MLQTQRKTNRQLIEDANEQGLEYPHQPRGQDVKELTGNFAVLDFGEPVSTLMLLL